MSIGVRKYGIETLTKSGVAAVVSAPVVVRL